MRKDVAVSNLFGVAEAHIKVAYGIHITHSTINTATSFLIVCFVCLLLAKINIKSDMQNKI